MQHSASSEALGSDQAKAVSTHEFLLQAERRDGGFVVTGVEIDGKQVFPGKSQRAQLQFNDLSDLETWLVRKIAPAAKVDSVDYPELQQPLQREEQVPECMYNAPVKMQITKVRRSISPAESRPGGVASFFPSPVPSGASKLFSEAPKSLVKQPASEATEDAATEAPAEVEAAQSAATEEEHAQTEVEQAPTSQSQFGEMSEATAAAAATNGHPEVVEPRPGPLHIAAELFPEAGDDDVHSAKSDPQLPFSAAAASTERTTLRRSTSSTAIKATLRPAADLFGSSGADVGLDYFSVDKPEPANAKPPRVSLGSQQQYGSAADLFGGPSSSDFASSPFASPPSSVYTHSPPPSSGGLAPEAIEDVFSQPPLCTGSGPFGTPQLPTSPVGPAPVLQLTGTSPSLSTGAAASPAAELFGSSSPNLVALTFDAPPPSDSATSSTSGFDIQVGAGNGVAAATVATPPPSDRSATPTQEVEQEKQPTGPPKQSPRDDAADFFASPPASGAVAVEEPATQQAVSTPTPPTSTGKAPGSASSSDRGSSNKAATRPQVQPLPDLFGSGAADDPFSIRSPPTRAASMIFEKPPSSTPLTTTSSPGVAAHPRGPKRSMSELPPSHTFMGAGAGLGKGGVTRPPVVDGSPFSAAAGPQNEAAALFSQTIPEETFRLPPAAPSSSVEQGKRGGSPRPPLGMVTQPGPSAVDFFSNPPPATSFSPSATHAKQPQQAQPLQTQQAQPLQPQQPQQTQPTQQKPAGRPASQRPRTNHAAMALLAAQSQPATSTPPSSSGSQPGAMAADGHQFQQAPPTSGTAAAGSAAHVFSRTQSHASFLKPPSATSPPPSATSPLQTSQSFYGPAGVVAPASAGFPAQPSHPAPVTAAIGGATHPTHRHSDSLPHFQQYGVTSPVTAPQTQKRFSNVPRVTRGKPAGPVVSFGYGGKICVMFPKADTRQFIGVPSGHSVKQTCGPVKVMKLNSIVRTSEALDVAVDPLVRPISPKSKQSEVLAAIDEMLRNLSAARSQPSLITLLRVLRCLVEGNGLVSSSEGMADPSSPESRLVRLLNSADASAPVAAEPSRGFLGFGSKAAIQPEAPEMQAAAAGAEASIALYESFLPQLAHSSTTVTAGDFQALETMLLEGRRAEAARAAAEMKLWGPALLFASVCEREVYQEIAKLCVGASFPKGSPLYMVALLYAGIAEDAIKHGGKTLNQHATSGAAFGQPAASSGLQSSWKRMLAAILANKTSGWQQLIRNLGQRLETELGDFAAAHVCYVTAGVLPSPAMFRADRAASQSTYLLLGVDSRTQTFFSPQALYGLKFTEILEWCVCQSSKEPGLPVLSPLKLAYANFLADLGYMSEGEAYLALCKETFQAISQKAKRVSNKGPKGGKPPSPFPPLHEYLLHVSEDRLLQSQNKAAIDHRALSKSWLGGAMSLLETSFRKIVDEPQNAAGVPAAPGSSGGQQQQQPAQTSTPPTSTTTYAPAMSSIPPHLSGGMATGPAPASFPTPYRQQQMPSYQPAQTPPAAAAGASMPHPGMVDVPLTTLTPQEGPASHPGYGYPQPSPFQNPAASTTTAPSAFPAHPGAITSPFGAPASSMQQPQQQFPQQFKQQQQQPQPQQQPHQQPQQQPAGQKPAEPAQPEKKPASEKSPGKSGGGGGFLKWLGFGGGSGKKEADLGEQMEAYFDKERKVWVFPGQEEEDIKPLGPPPTASSAPASVGGSQLNGGPAPSGSGSEQPYDPLAALMAPPLRSAAADPLAALMAPPSRDMYSSAPPSAMGGPPMGGPPMGGPPMGGPPMGGPPTGGPPTGGPPTGGSGSTPPPKYTVFTPFPTASTSSTSPAPTAPGSSSEQSS